MSKLHLLNQQSRVQRTALGEFDLTGIDAITLNTSTPKQLLWHLINVVKSPPLCMSDGCNNNTKWDIRDNKHLSESRGRYRSYCSLKCSNNSHDVKKLKEDTSVKNYGSKYHNQSAEGKSARVITNISRYGYSNPSMNESIKQKKQQTTYNNYNVDNPSKSKIIQDKKSSTSIERYGSSHFNNKHILPKYQLILADKEKLAAELDLMSIRELADKFGVNKSTIIRKIHAHGIISYLKSSYLEKEMEQFLISLDISFDMNTRKMISPLELDFYLPDYKIAIEMNGDYWHSDNKRTDKKYHYNKWERCNSQDISLIQILETDWNTNQDKIKKMIASRLHKKSSVKGARKCTIGLITGSAANAFLTRHHMQGKTASSFCYGAFDEYLILRAVMTFGYTRGSKAQRNFELKRWVTDNIHSYPGLFSKTFKFAQQDLDFNTVVSFSMNDWFDGNMYAKAGFELDMIQQPSYKYLWDDKWQHCSYFTKANIRKKFKDNTIVIQMLDAGETEFTIMDYLGVCRTWDSGKKRWQWHK
jgi:very-short-patch-repair endonuclease